MRIGIIGNGTLASALGAAWVRAGHHVKITGRDHHRAHRTARRIGAVATAPREVADGSDAILLAVTWAGVPEALRLVEPGLSGRVLIDPTNPVDHGVGRLLTTSSAAEEIAARAAGAHVVKAFHLFPAEQWERPATAADRVLVPLASDNAGALEITSRLVADVGARPIIFGGLDRARQLEEAAGVVIGLAFAGADPRAAVPHVGG